ncbi:MAG: PH domain-containing protein [Planctomycetota bacterium]|nr:PH domain-containing protein [Planctomycetota bacterium]
MQCSQCEAEIPKNARYCSNCGVSVASSNSASPNPRSFSYGGVLPEEQTLWVGHVSWRALIPHMLLAVIATVVWSVAAPTETQIASELSYRQVFWLGLLAIWGFLLVYLAYRHWNESYLLTSRRIVYKKGILYRSTNFTEVIDVDDIGVEQSLWDRILGIGTVRISASDESHPLLRISGVYAAAEIAVLIDNTRHRERAARGLHVEVI